jgi:chemotaxis-related protein WspD
MSTGDTAPQSGPTTAASCWNEIGVMGDHTCPELAVAIHCRNCNVFAMAARNFLDRPAPAGYLAEWTRLLDQADSGADFDAARDGVGVLIFRLGAEWLALRAQVVVEVTLVRPVHRIPRRSNEIVVGLVSLRGQLQLCASLHGLLGAGARASTDAAVPSNRSARMIVIRHEAESWAFTADEVLGVPRVPPELWRSVPSTLANPTVSFSQAVFTWQGRSVGLLDEARVFAALGSVCQ